MRRGALLWGIIIIIVGVLFLLENLGIITINIWGLILPLLAIALGAWILWGILAPHPAKIEHIDIPLDGATQARINIRHGAGRLQVDAGAGVGRLLEGDCDGGAELNTRRTANALEVTLGVLYRSLPFIWGPEYLMNWKLGLAQDVPLELSFDTGAADTRIDLSQLIVHQIRYHSGASSTWMTLPANAGQTTAVFKTGAASLELRIPSGVAAYIQTSSGLSSITVDKNRFPRIGNGYKSADYDVATNKVDIRVEMGVGSVDIR
jgi:hypothetical protein